MSEDLLSLTKELVKEGYIHNSLIEMDDFFLEKGRTVFNEFKNFIPPNDTTDFYQVTLNKFVKSEQKYSTYINKLDQGTDEYNLLLLMLF